MNAAVHRRFWLIFIGSVLLHGTVFWWTAATRTAKRPDLPPVFASLRQAAASVNVVVPPAAPLNGVSVAPAAELPQKVRRESPHPVAKVPPVAARPAGPANAPATVPAQAAETASRGVSDLPNNPVPAVVAHTEPAPTRPSGETLDGYRQRLTALLAGVQDYPRVAALRGWEGEVRLRLKIARKGNLLGIALDRSSGYDVLDRHALAMLEGRGDLPPLPEALDASEIQVIVPINYKLRKTT